MTMRLLICMRVEVEIKRIAQTHKITFEIRMIRPPPRDTCLLSHQSQSLHVLQRAAAGLTERPYSFSYGEYSIGYHFLFYPPRQRARVNIQLLLIQIAAVGLASAGLALAVRKP